MVAEEESPYYITVYYKLSRHLYSAYRRGGGSRINHKQTRERKHGDALHTQWKEKKNELVISVVLCNHLLFLLSQK